VAKLKVTWRKSAIGYPEDQKLTIEALGLKRINSSNVFEDSCAIRGMITKVRHLVKVEVIQVRPSSKKRSRTKQAKEGAN
jgi:large subunit ribosomal protein L30